MEVLFVFKYIVSFLHFIDNTRGFTANIGKEVHIHRQKVSNAGKGITLQWPKGIVSYYMDNLTYDSYITQRLRLAMNVLESASCVRFKPTVTKPASNDSTTWIHFTNPQQKRNCVHEPEFKDNGEIILVLGFDCLKEHEILHTLLHAIGFEDEVSHPQRDQYIRVMWNNIQPDYRHLYRIRSSNLVMPKQLVEYDPLSVMHFHDRAFSLNGHATIMPLMPGLLISPSNDLSQLDKMKLRLLFDHECNKRKVGDMIDTCKLLLSNNAGPSELKNETVPKSEEKLAEQGHLDESGTIDEVDNIEDIPSEKPSHLNTIDNQYDLEENNKDYKIEK